MTRLKDKTALITGASSGIGSAIALAYAEQGARVLIHYNSNESGASQVYEQIMAAGGKAALIQADLSSDAGISTLMQHQLLDKYAVDVWVNNAGADILTGANAKSSDDQKLAQLIKVDLLGTIRCCWAIAPVMQERGSGVIINMSWDLAIIGFGGRNPEMFAAVKAGVLGFSKSLALGVAPQVRVNVLAPGWIKTSFADDEMDQEYYQARISEIPLGRFGMADDVARAAVYLASDEAAYITGQVLNINGGLI